MKLLGYSERGLMNSLFYSLIHRPDGAGLLGELLASTTFPGLAGAPIHWQACNVIYLEQSLSDFGDADAIILLGQPGNGQVIFIEAKRGASFRTCDEWNRFLYGGKFNTRVPGLSSNVFGQLYLKQRFIKALGSPTSVLSELDQGLDFPAPLAKTRGRRKIGNNPVVRQVAQHIAQHAQEVYYLMLLPEASERIAASLKACSPCYPDMDLSRLGFLSLHEVHNFCQNHDLTQVMQIFEFNGQQLISPIK